MVSYTEAGNAQVQWTPEQKVQAFKEVITAILGVMVVGYTLYLAAQSFGLVDATRIAHAKDILQVVLGVAGVVIGYYFGRVPADARATQAQEQANAASAKTEEVKAQAAAMATHVEHVIDKVAPAAAAAHAAAPSLDPSSFTAELQKIRDDLRALSSLRT